MTLQDKKGNDYKCTACGSVLHIKDLGFCKRSQNYESVIYCECYSIIACVGLDQCAAGRYISDTEKAKNIDRWFPALY